MSLTKTPIVDRNGHASHRWMKPADTDGSVARVASISLSRSTGVPMLAGSPVPELSFEHLYHVGSLDASHKKNWSLEGGGLSVSRNPSAWRAIAYLQGDTYEFAVDDNRFLDYHELSDAQRKAIEEYGVEKGYLRPQKIYRVEWWDDEAEDTAFMLITDEDEAMTEAENMEVEPIVIDGYVATDSFPDNTVNDGKTEYAQVLAAVWVNEAVPELDGVWWEDRLHVSGYTAPRGVLSLSKVDEWISSASAVADDAVIEEDEDEYSDEEDY